METKFETWLISRIDDVEKRLKQAMARNDPVFTLVYKAGRDILLEVLRAYREHNGKSDQ